MPTGQKRSFFAEAAIIPDSPEGQVSLSNLARHQKDQVAKLESARQQYQSELAAAWENKKTELLRIVQPGTFLGGVLVNGETTTPVSLEIVRLDLNYGSIEALFRNDGSWSLSRPVSGSISWDKNNGTMLLNLKMVQEDAVNNGGPILDWNRFGLVVNCTAVNKTVTAKNGWGNLELHPLSTVEATALKTQLLNAEMRLTEIVKPGNVYRVTANHDNGEIAKYLLRFEQLNGIETFITAKLTPVDRDDRSRLFQVKVISNRYQARGWPIQLASLRNQAGNGGDELLGGYSVGSVRLKVNGEGLLGDANGYKLTLDPASPDFIRELTDRQENRRRQLMSIVNRREGYVGFCQNSGNDQIERFCVKFDYVNPENGRMTVNLSSPENPQWHRRASGELKTYDKQLLIKIESGERDQTGILKASLFNSTQPINLIFSIEDEKLSAKYSESDWNLTIPLDKTFQSKALAEAKIPTQNGMYVLAGNIWTPLPVNGFRVVQSAGAITANILESFTTPAEVAANRASKLAEVVFDGNEPVPTVDRRRVVILYVGQVTPTPYAIKQRYPNYPTIQMESIHSDSEGKRRGDLVRIVPGIAGFGENRVTSTVFQIDTDRTMFIPRPGLYAGRYVVGVNSGGYELEVK